MRKTYLILDGNYLAWRTFFAMSKLVNGVTFGLLRDVQYLTEQHATPHVVFCFDHGKGLREAISPAYKSGRRTKVVSDEDAEGIAEMRKEVERLKASVLAGFGFANVFYQQGYEADDVCAGLVRQLRLQGDDCILVSADHDLYQLLAGDVCLWDPHRRTCITDESFRREWGIAPGEWVHVKAVAGCPTDDVRGVPGVGEKTAAKFVRGELAPGSAKHAAITEFINSKEYDANLSLVTLPLPGLKEFAVSDKPVERKQWNRAAEAFGMRSLKDRQPGRSGTGFGIRPTG